MRACSHPGESDRLIWGMLACLACACLIAGHGLGFGVSAWRAILPGAGLLVLGMALAVGRERGHPRLAAGAAAFLQMTLFTIGGVVLSYLLAARGGALWDARLAVADRWLGFDWPAVLRRADDSPVALLIGWVAYNSLTVQMVAAIVVLAAGRRFEALRLAVAAAILSGFVTILISGAVPAMGNLFDPAAFHHLSASIAWQERALIAGLRDGRVRVLDLGHLMGIVSFPSYHATLPVILAWSLRDVARWQMVAPVWAGVTIAATPMFGGHYGVDVLAGLVLAAAAIALAPRLARRRQPLDLPIRSPDLAKGATAVDRQARKGASWSGA